MISSMRPAILAALVSALLFGASTPLAKVLLAQVPPLALAGLLYLGAGLGLALLRWAWRGLGPETTAQEASLAGADWWWLAGSILAGGVVAPVLLMLGLAQTQAASAALLLNLEGVFTALLAWFVFHENVDRRVAIGFFLIAGAGVLLSWEGAPAAGVLVRPQRHPGKAFDPSGAAARKPRKPAVRRTRHPRSSASQFDLAEPLPGALGSGQHHRDRRHRRLSRHAGPRHQTLALRA